MKKYSETKNRAPFDWNVALSKNCKDMTQKEVSKLESMAKSWVTCACGNQCAIIPRHKMDSDDGLKGSPIDEVLNDLGSDFYSEAISEMASNMGNYFTTNEELFDDWKSQYLKDANKARLKALRILKQIEKRSAKLISEEEKRAKKILQHLGYNIQ